MAAGRLLAALLIAGAMGAPAGALPGGSVEQFPASYFAASHPADAYDMIRKIPGFVLIEGDEDVRGFSGSRGNVLFDGRSPSGKQESLEQMLRRIPAASVLRIELIRGGAKSAATEGYDLVANLVRRSLAATSASATGGASAAKAIGVKPDFRIELSHEAGRRRLTGAAAMATDIDDDSGRGTIFERDTDSVLVGREERAEREFTRTLSAAGEYKLPLGSGELIANVNIARERGSERVSTQDEDSLTIATERERLWSGEGGAQYRRPLGAGEIEVLASHRIGRLRSRAEEDDESFTESRRTSESIARAEYRGGSDGLRWFASAEGALNRLSSDAELRAGGAEIPLAGLDVRVSERRAETALGAIWQAAETALIEPSMRAELSNIRSTGDRPQDRSYLFLKPRLRVSWNRGPNRVQATVEREAAQLDFGDFVASAELDRDDVLAGATSLRPPTTWSVSVTYERRFWGEGALLLTARREWIDDVIDRVIIDQGGELFDAVGNIGKGTRSILRAELTAPLSHLGLRGVELRGALTFLKSRVTDSVTGERRIIAEDRPFEGELKLTHDFPGGRWSWGADASFAHREREFRFDERRLERKGNSVGAHVEFRPGANWRVRVAAENLSSRNLVEVREHFGGLRSAAPLKSVETRLIRTSPIFILSVRRAFGGH